MQIDFHHAVTYVVSRLAGFSKEEADIIAYSAQYVDDAVNSGTIEFDTRAAYRFISSAHKMLDYRNFEKLANHDVWIPFHFLPGNKIDENLEGKVSNFVQKTICRPNSEVAQAVLEHVIKSNNKKFSLHLLGVTSHTYVDTWAHQGFAGISHQVNEVHEIYDSVGELDEEMINYRNKFFKKPLLQWLWEKILEILKMRFINEISPLGHGPALSYPDLPYLHWKYKDWKGDIIDRNNPNDFMEAVKHLYAFMRRFRSLDVESINESDLKKIEEIFRNNTHEDGEERLKVWWNEIANGSFSFGAEKCEYFSSGMDSWIFHALGVQDNEGFNNKETYKFNPKFMDSHWKHLHDALYYFRFSVLHEVLPKFGICAV